MTPSCAPSTTSAWPRRWRARRSARSSRCVVWDAPQRAEGAGAALSGGEAGGAGPRQRSPRAPRPHTERSLHRGRRRPSSSSSGVASGGGGQPAQCVHACMQARGRRLMSTQPAAVVRGWGLTAAAAAALGCAATCRMGNSHRPPMHTCPRKRPRHAPPHHRRATSSRSWAARTSRASP